MKEGWNAVLPARPRFRLSGPVFTAKSQTTQSKPIEKAAHTIYPLSSNAPAPTARGLAGGPQTEFLPSHLDEALRKQGVDRPPVRPEPAGHADCFAQHGRRPVRIDLPQKLRPSEQLLESPIQDAGI